MKPVFVFKTSVISNQQVKELKPKLDMLIQKDERWNFDLMDCDNILRVETTSCDGTRVMEVLLSAGYDCEELQ